jgi:ribosomal protein S18 acetylase RimI-like enzyme
VTAFDRIAPLSPAHDLSTFDCGSEAQTSWLRRHALQAQQADTARVFVACLAGTTRVAGFYALAAGSVQGEQAPARLTRGIGRYPVPVVVLARLGVDRDAQGQRLGSSLVRDALLQTAAIAERLGVRALVIHAETPRAAGFYRGIDAAFEPMPGEPLHLVLLMKDLRKAIGLAVTHAPLSGG